MNGAPLQVEVRDVELEPEPVGQDPRAEDTGGIDRLESRYAGVRAFGTLLLVSTRIDGPSAIRGRLR